MRSRYDRDAITCNVNPKFEAAGVNVRKVCANEVFAFMRNIEENAVKSALFHLEVDGSSHHISGG